MIKYPKLVLSDIDGTLLNDKKEMTDKTKSVLTDLHRQDVLLGIASGRPIDDILLQEQSWQLRSEFDLIIGLNGAELLDRIHLRRDTFHKLSRKQAYEIIQLMQPYQKNPYVYRGGILRSYIDRKAFVAAQKSGVVVKGKLEALQVEEFGKILYHLNEEIANEVQQYVRIYPVQGVQGYRTQSTVFEFVHAGTSKAEALFCFAKRHQIQLNEVIAFGDMPNDVEMLKASGMGICMKNGSEEAKCAADRITEKTNNDDGLASYLRKNILAVET